MTVDVSRQGILFLWAAVTGIGMGLLYDLGRGIRRLRPRLTMVMDGVFGLEVLLIFLLTMVYTDALRLYQLLGMFLGAGLYFLTVSPWVLGFWQGLLGRGAALLRAVLELGKKSGRFLQKNVKKLFPSPGKWGTINTKSRVSIRGKKRRSAG